MSPRGEQNAPGVTKTRGVVRLGVDLGGVVRLGVNLGGVVVSVSGLSDRCLASQTALLPTKFDI
jgi:hypothetical protein